MTDTPSENQQELFSEFQPERKKTGRIPALAGSHKPILISTTTEQMILTAIVVILAACFIFFLGLLRGKSIAVSQRPATKASAGAPPARPAVVLQTVPAAPAAKPLVVVANPAKPYTIQLVTYKRKELAEREAAVLRSSGFFSHIISSGEYYAVCAGQYANKEEAKRDLRFFGAKYKDCFLRRR